MDEQLKPDFSLETPQERVACVEKIIASTPPEQLTNRYLTYLSDYIIFAIDKEERKQRKILTEERMVTVNKNETSFQGLMEQLGNGEDGIYNMIANDKNIILTPNLKITQKDKDEIPALAELCKAIEQVEKSYAVATGRRKFLLKQQLIDMHKDQYVIRSAYRKPIYCLKVTKSLSQIHMDEEIAIDAESGAVSSTGPVSLFNPVHISALLCHYSRLKEDSYGKFWCDSYYLMEDLDSLIIEALADEPILFDILVYKIDGLSNETIKERLLANYNISYTLEYISSLWRHKIPKLLADFAQEQYYNWYFLEKERGQYKKCTRCGQIKLKSTRYFSKNGTSGDGYYSICKCCRSTKRKKE